MSNLPDWYSAALKVHAAKQRAVQEAIQPLEVPIRDSFSTAPGWRDLGIEYTCIPDPMYPWDPNVLRAIWSFDPGAIPMWIRWKFLSPSEGQEEVVVFGRHAIGRHVKNPHSELTTLPVSMPTMPCQGVRFDRPNLVELVAVGKPDPRASDLPGAYFPFGWGLFHYLRTQYTEKSTKAYMEAIKAQKAASEAAFEKAKQEEAYRREDLRKFVDSKLAQVSELDMRDRMLGKRTKVKKLFLDLAKSGLPAA